MKTTHSLARLATLAAMLAAVGSSACAAEQRTGSIANVLVVDKSTGQTLTVFRSQGQYWVAGEPGHAYSISLRNQNAARVLGVVSVDGVNVISGQTAWRNELASQTGYVLAARGTMQIAGWRKNQGEVATFEFAAPEASYAAQTGRGNDIGAIGVALFRERVEPPAVYVPSPPPVSANTPLPDRLSRNDSARAGADSSGSFDARGAIEARKVAPAPAAEAPSSRSSAAATPAAPGLGTGHGERQASWVNYTNFERASQVPDEVVVIRYDRRETLVARGIIPGGQPRLSDPFPVAAGSFVPDPPGQ